MINVLEKYLHQNNYFQIAHEDLKLQLMSHPDYPSLKAVTDTLDYFNIDNIAVNVPGETLEQLPVFFIAVVKHSTLDKNVMVVKKNNGRISIRFEEGNKTTMTEKEFKEIWTGDTILVEPITNKRKSTIDRSILLVSFLLGTFLLLQISLFNWPLAILSVLSIVGIYLSYLIINEELGKHSKAVMKVCRAVSKTSNCTEVITAKTSKLFGIIALSDLTVIFFTFSFLTFSLLGVNSFFCLSIAVISIPIILFSIYQQAVVLRNWCALCLGISFIILLQGVVALLLPADNSTSPDYFTRSGLILAITAVLWLAVKPALVSNYKLKNLERDFLKFKRNPDLFQALVKSREPIIGATIPIQHQIYFGTDNPLVTINAVTNPMCGFCTESFKVYEQLLSGHQETVRINFVFSVPLSDRSNRATHIAAKVIELYNNNGKDKAFACLQTWFANRDIEKWQLGYGSMTTLEQDVEATLTHHSDWCKENKIDYTPATLLENRLFPKEYQIADLVLLIDDIIQQKVEISEPELEEVG